MAIFFIINHPALGRTIKPSYILLILGQNNMLYRIYTNTFMPVGWAALVVVTRIGLDFQEQVLRTEKHF